MAQILATSTKIELNPTPSAINNNFGKTSNEITTCFFFAKLIACLVYILLDVVTELLDIVLYW